MDHRMKETPHFAPTRWKHAYRWHGDMLADKKRNQAYAAAIREWVARQIAIRLKSTKLLPSPVVLEIGTGSGLLSGLVALEVARQWPALGQTTTHPPPRIVACETVRELHEVAARTFERLASPPAVGSNDLVELLPRTHSLDLPASWLPRSGAHLVLGELLDTGLLGEGLVGSMRDASSRLCARRVTTTDTKEEDQRQSSPCGGRVCFDALPAFGTVVCVPVHGFLVRSMSGLLPATDPFYSRRCRLAGGDEDSAEEGFASSSSLSTSPRLLRGFRAPRACSECLGSAAAEGLHLRWTNGKRRQQQTRAHGDGRVGVGRGVGGGGGVDNGRGGNLKHQLTAVTSNEAAAAQLSPEAIEECSNGDDVHRDRNIDAGNDFDDDVDGLVPLAAPQEALSLDFHCPPLEGRGKRLWFEVAAGSDCGDGGTTTTVDGIAYWWHVGMLADETTTTATTCSSRSSIPISAAAMTLAPSPVLPRMSTAPLETAAPDHWRQNLVPFPTPLVARRGDVCVVELAHDEHMVWVEHVEIIAKTRVAKKSPPPSLLSKPSTTMASAALLATASSSEPATAEAAEASAASSSATLVPPEPTAAPPVCACGLHSHLSRQRLASLNDPRRRQTLCAAVEELLLVQAAHSQQQQRPTQGARQQQGEFGGGDGGGGVSSSSSISSGGGGDGLVVVLGDGPLLPFIYAKAGFHVLVVRFPASSSSSSSIASRVVETYEGGSGSGGGCGGGSFGRWLTLNCAASIATDTAGREDKEEEEIVRRISFVDVPSWGVDDVDGGDTGDDAGAQVREHESGMPSTGTAGGMRPALRRAVAAALFNMTQGQSEASLYRRRGDKRNSDDSSSSSSSSSGVVVGVVAEPFFGELDEQGGAGGGGWGWESLLLFASAVHALVSGEDEDVEGVDSTGGGGTGACGGDSDGGLLDQCIERAPVKRQRCGQEPLPTTASLSSTSSSSSSSSGASSSPPSPQQQPPPSMATAAAAAAVAAKHPPPVAPLAVLPCRAVIRGAFLRAEDLWSTLQTAGDATSTEADTPTTIDETSSPAAAAAVAAAAAASSALPASSSVGNGNSADGGSSSASSSSSSSSDLARNNNAICIDEDGATTEDRRSRRRAVVMVEGVDMGAAFECEEGAPPVKEDEEEQSGGKTEEGDASTARPSSFLRCSVTGDAAADAVPFPLAQWGGSSLVVGEVLDLLTLRLDGRSGGNNDNDKDASGGGGDLAGAGIRVGAGVGGGSRSDGSGGDNADLNDDDYDDSEKEGGCWAEHTVTLGPLVATLVERERSFGTLLGHEVASKTSKRDAPAAAVPTTTAETATATKTTTAHVLALWIDYELSPTPSSSSSSSGTAVSPLSSASPSRSSWLRHGPDIWYARQGVLAFDTPIDVLALEDTRIRTVVNLDGSLNLSFVT